jgi:beta,beta-carotene 9',10'-dioxygenase
LAKGVNLVQSDGSSCTAKLEGADVIRITGQQLGPAGFENPSVHPQTIGKPYQYVYGSGLFEGGFYANSVGKLDVKSKEVHLYKRVSTEFPGEPVFVPRPNGVAEDDGVLITQVLNTDPTKHNYLAVLDAQTMDELAVIEFDRNAVQLPPSVHGLWQWPIVATEDLQKSEQ